MSRTKKLRELENSVVEEPSEEHSKLCICCMPRAERILMQKGRDIALKHPEQTWNDLTAEEQQIFDQSSRHLLSHILDLFVACLEVHCLEDKHAIQRTHARLAWFLRELNKEITQELEVAEIERNANPDSEVDEVDQYYRKAPKCFTEESFYNFLDEVDREFWKTHPEALEKIREQLDNEEQEAKPHG